MAASFLATNLETGVDHKLEPGTVAAYAPPMTEADGDSTQTSRSRLLSVAKSLFGQNGYDQTSTSAIARAAGTSESQLMRYFGGKAGLLEAIFNEAWTGLGGSVARIVGEAPHAREATLRLLVMMMTALGRDHDIAVLFLLEGRRMRGATHEVFLSQGFVQFFKILCGLIEKGQHEGSFRDDVKPVVLASAIMGCAEGMMRDRLVAERSDGESAFDDVSVRTTFASMVNGLAPSPSAAGSVAEPTKS